MANKESRIITEEEYIELITAIRDGIGKCRANPRVALMLQIEATTLLRISDILNLKLSSFAKAGSAYHLDIIEQKTQKPRRYEVPEAVVNALRDYALEKGLGKNDPLFPVTERAVNKHLQAVCEALTTPEHSYAGIGTHSFRKFGATKIYTESGYNTELVSRCLQHSSVAITRRYICLTENEVNAALLANNCMI